MQNIGCTVVIVLYFSLVIYMTFRGTHRSAGEENFSEDFYVGGRKIGPIALAILVAAGVCSTGTFVGGPGLAGANGLGYTVLFGCEQVCMNLFILGIIGKKMNIIGRRTNSQSYIDIFRFRYENYKPLIIVLVVAILVFLVSSASAEFVGGSRVIEVVTGIPYVWSIIAFGALITVYTATGGLTGVSIVGVLQGFLMTAATLIIVIGYMVFFGGMGNVIESLESLSPALLTPTNGGTFSMALFFDRTCTYSIGVIGLPWAVQSALSYKDTKTMKQAITIGIVMAAIWSVLLCGFAGLAARAFAPDVAVSDYFIPTLALGVLPNVLAGIVLAGVAGAGQSTIAALFILAASTIVINVYKAYVNPNATDKQIKKASVITCACVGILDIILALTNPPTLQIFITFAAGGCACALIPGLVMGLYWPRCNKYGAFAGVLTGLVFYAVFTLVDFGVPFMKDCPLLCTAPISFLSCYLVSKFTAPTGKEAITLYFAEMEEPAK